MWETNPNSGFVREHIRWGALGCSLLLLKRKSTTLCYCCGNNAEFTPKQPPVYTVRTHTQMESYTNVFRDALKLEEKKKKSSTRVTHLYALHTCIIHMYTQLPHWNTNTHSLTNINRRVCLGAILNETT